MPGRRAVTWSIIAAGSLAWSAYVGRLLVRALHMLQLEGYETARFLRWSIAKRERWARTDHVLSALAGAAIGGMLARPSHREARLFSGPLCLKGNPLTPGPSPSRGEGWGLTGRRVGAILAWAGLGAWLWRGARFGQAKKPLVLTARARRLAAGQALLGVGVAVGPSLGLAIGGGRHRRRASGALLIGLSSASLMTPLIAAGANLLLWPAEESLRRYYLRDAARRLRAYGPTVVAVAGSYGKTSTKEFLGSLLATRWRVLKPPGSYNTPMGLSRVIREQLAPSHELLVAELGDYRPGDIRFLCGLLRPRIGVLTTIGPEHLERFKTLERVVETKAELMEALPPHGIAIVNQDDPLVRALGERAAARGLRVVRYGQDEPGAQVTARDVQTTSDGLAFRVAAKGHGEADFRVGVLGRHNVANVLAATAAALELGMSLADVASAAERIGPVEHRLQPVRGEGGVLVIDDAFNSNPRGAAEALDVLAELDGGRRVLVTPGIVELAEREFDENRKLGRKAAAVCDEVILVGQERAAPILAGLWDAGYPRAKTHVVRDLAEATSRLQGLVGPGDIVLFENDLPDTYE